METTRRWIFYFQAKQETDDARKIQVKGVKKKTERVIEKVKRK